MLRSTVLFHCIAWSLSAAAPSAAEDTVRLRMDGGGPSDLRLHYRLTSQAGPARSCTLPCEATLHVEETDALVISGLLPGERARPLLTIQRPRDEVSLRVEYRDRSAWRVVGAVAAGAGALAVMSAFFPGPSQGDEFRIDLFGTHPAYPYVAATGLAVIAIAMIFRMLDDHLEVRRRRPR